MRPTRFILGTEGKLTVGRDPANDIWINTPHISRCHLQLEWFEDGRIVEEGRHTDLLRRPDSVYARLYAMQALELAA